VVRNVSANGALIIVVTNSPPIPHMPKNAAKARESGANSTPITGPNIGKRIPSA